MSDTNGWTTMSPKRGRELLEDAARRFLDMSAEEFITKWEAGEFNGSSSSRRVLRVVEMLPFGR